MGSAASSPSPDEVHERAEEQTNALITEIRTSIWRTECEIKTLEKQLKNQLGASHNKSVAEILASKREKLDELYANLQAASARLDKIQISRVKDKSRALCVDATDEPPTEAAEREIQMAVENKLPVVPKDQI